MKRYLNTILIIIPALILFMCKGKPDEAAHHDDMQFTCPMHPQIIQASPGTCPVCGMNLEKVNQTAGDGAIMLNESQIKLANITTAVARPGDMGENIILTGKVMVNEDQAKVISSRVEGRIERLYVKEPGQSILKDQPIYEIYSEQLLTLQQEYLMTVRQKEEMKGQRYDDFVTAAQKKLTLFGMSMKQIEKLANAKKTESRITFYAPESGVISEIQVYEGQYVTGGTSLFRIDKLDQLWVAAALYPGESSSVKVGDVIKIQVSGFEDRPQIGKVSFISPSYDRGTQVTTMRSVLNNAEGKFLPGMLATVYLSHDEKKVISLPVDAVIHDANGSHVWILGEDGAFRQRKVMTGLENFDAVEIREGIKENEKVVVSGAYLLYGELVLKKGNQIISSN